MPIYPVRLVPTSIIDLQPIRSETTDVYHVLICDSIEHFTLPFQYRAHFFRTPGDTLEETIDASAVAPERKYQIWHVMDLLNSGLYAGINVAEFCRELLG